MKTLVAFLLLSIRCLAVPATYYIDCASGSDSNNGTSKATPWAHAPGMTGTSAGVGPGAIDTANGVGGICLSGCSLPGDQFIFKGGTTCGSANFKWTIRESGTALVIGTSAVYFGVDQTWYTGASWTRPIFDFGGQAGGNKCFPMIQMAPVTYAIIDNLEFTGLYWDHTCNGGSNGTETYIAISAATNSDFRNLYAHGWSHEAYAPNSTADVCDLFAGTTSGNDNNSFHDSVIDGSDSQTNGPACVGIWGAPTTVYNNVIRYVPNGGIVGFPVDWHNNLLEFIQSSFDVTQHNQAFEDNGSTAAFYFYNNVIRNTTNCSGLTLNFTPKVGATTYVFNNVEYNTDDSPLNVQAAVGGGGTLLVENNTIELGADSVAGSGNAGLQNGSYPGCPTGMTSCVYRNNQFIGNKTQSDQVCQVACTDTTNLSQTLAVANGQGFTISQTYAFSPSASGNSTVGAGTNYTANCSGTLASLCSTTTYAVAYNATNHTVSASPINVLSRSSSAAWDIGAYQFAAIPGAIISGGVFSGGVGR